MGTNYVMRFTDVDMNTAVFENEFYIATIDKHALPNVKVSVEKTHSSLPLGDLIVLAPDSEDQKLRVMTRKKGCSSDGLLDVGAIEEYAQTVKVTAISARNLEHALRNYYNILNQLGGGLL